MSSTDNDPVINESPPPPPVGEANTICPRQQPASRSLPSSGEFDSVTSVEDFEVRINRILRRNNLLVVTINAVESVNKKVDYVTEHVVVAGVGRYVLKTLVEGCTKAEILASFTPVGSITPLTKQYGLSIDFSFTTAADVLRLTSELRDLAFLAIERCDNDAAGADDVAQLRLLGQNLLVLNDNLVALSDLVKGTRDRTHELEAKVAALNDTILQFHQSNSVLFQPPKPPLGLNISLEQYDALKKWVPALSNTANPPTTLYQMSVHGMDPKEFHSLCDGKGPTLCIYETSEGSIFGGFTSTSWASSGASAACSDAFIFSLVNPHRRDSPPSKFPVKRDKVGSAIYCYRDFYCVFGSGNPDIHAHDLKTSPAEQGSGVMYTNPGNCYEAPNKEVLSGERGTWYYTDITVISCPPS